MRKNLDQRLTALEAGAVAAQPQESFEALCARRGIYTGDDLCNAIARSNPNGAVWLRDLFEKVRERKRLAGGTNEQKF